MQWRHIKTGGLVLALMAGAVCLPHAALAQFRTSISGTITDQTGAVIPGATLTLRDQETNATQVRTSTDSGFYSFNALPADHFTVTIEAKGFLKKVINGYQPSPEQANGLNISLEIGGAAQTVTVEADTVPPIDTDTANTGRTITGNEVQHMPVFGRDIFQLTQLVPGAVSDGSQAGGGGTFELPGNQGPGGPGANGGIFATENGPQANANGGQYETNGITVDGISTVSAVWGGTTVITPSEDSVQSVKVVTNDYDAENGRFSGALTQVTSKSGTNDIHGSLFFQANRPGLNAYQRYNGPASLTDSSNNLKNTQDYNQFGGSVGGPIWRNKVFAFFSYETQRDNSNVTTTGWYDTSDFEGLSTAGSIANTYLTFPGSGVVAKNIINSTCKDAGLIEGVSCTAINNGASGLNIGTPLTSALGTQDLTYSSPTTPGVGSGLGTTADIANYVLLNPTNTVQEQYNGRLDADVTKNDHLAFAIYWVPITTTDYNGNRGYDVFHHDQVNDAFSLIWNHTFSPTFLNEARANAAGWRWNEIADNPQSPLGLPSDGFGTIGSITLNHFGPNVGSHLNQWTYGYKDVATKLLGNHSLKFGGEFTRLYYLNAPTGVPSYTFYNLWDFLNDAPMGESAGFNPVTGIPEGNRNDDRENLWGFFVQDDWKVKPNFTINVGLRYQYFDSLYSKQNNLGVPIFGSGSSYLTDLRIQQGGHFWHPQKLNFGPQFGFNYSPAYFHDKLVIRGGYGLNFNQEEIAITANAGFNPPAEWYPSFNGGTGPTNVDPRIIYAVSSDAHNMYGYPSNPNAITTFNTANLPTSGAASVTAVPSNLPTAYSQHYSLDVEYDLGHQWVANVGYQGSVSRHLIVQYQGNLVAAASGIALNPLVTNLDMYSSGGSSNNNQFLAGLKHQMSKSFSVDAQFAWGKSMDNNSGPYEEDQYPWNPALAYGRSDFNVGKSLKVFGLWQPVFFHGEHGWIEKVAGGWSLSGILNLHTGFGWTPTYSLPSKINGNDVSNVLMVNGSGLSSLRPKYLGGAKHSTSNDAFKTGDNFAGIANSGTWNGTAYTNAYFSVPDYTSAIAPSTFPNVASSLPPLPGVARNSFDGPGYRDVDMTLTKSFGLPKAPVLGDNAQLEIRADVLNLFNLLNFTPGSIANDINASDFGQAQSALGSRTITLEARFHF